MLNTKSYTLLTLLVLSFAIPALATKKNHKYSTDLVKQLHQTLSSAGISDSSVSVYVGLEGQELFSINPHKKFTPASVTKLVTAGAFLKKFPPGSKFKTQLASNAKIQNGVLKGDLYLVGGGDPSFVSENMWFLVNAFLRTGIQKIEGDLVVDDSLFDTLRCDPSRQKERVDRAYDAPVGAMSFNWNSVNIFVRPGLKEGEPAEVFADPANEYVQIKNLVKTSASGTSVSAERGEDGNGDHDIVKVTGKISIGSKELVIYKNITQPDIWSGYNLKSFLAQRNIQVTGKVKNGVMSAGATILAENESKPLQDILADMNKFSNNYIAEMLTKNIAALQKKPGNLETGMKELRSYMEKLGVAQGEYELYNPSGLTRDNKMSAFSLWKVLEDQKNDFQIQPELVSSLPIAGIDGTLKHRMKNGPAERWVRAKTGSLNDVVSIAGYAGRRNGEVVSFVYIYNKVDKHGIDEGKVRSVFDRMASVLLESE
jgi:D-alanyl-D-alanine carboxypeptidase/D-alanyl-D-alanine-endopeptidase (penicillin-binding protein 4)